MRRIIGTLALGGALLMATAPAVAAYEGSTCGDLFGYPHGYHIVADYVTGVGSTVLGGPGIEWPPRGLNAAGGAALPGGPGPGFHFPNNIPPGASFCNEQAHSGGR